MSINRNSAGNPIYPVGNLVISEDANFIAGDSPRVIDIAGTLGYNANTGYVRVDGSGDLLVEISHTGAGYLTQFTLKNGDNFSLSGLEVARIRLTHSGTNTSYRLFAS